MIRIYYPGNLSGGRIDHAHHYNNPYRALEETLVLESTLEAIMSKVDLSDTLIVVTADHSHVMTMGGLATPRGNDILGTCNFIPTQYCAIQSNILDVLFIFCH